MGNNGLEFFIAAGQQQRGPFPVDRLLVEGVTAQTLVWRDGMPSWQAAGKVTELVHLFASPAESVPPPMAQAAPIGYSGPAFVPPGTPVPTDVSSKKVLAGVMAIIFGSLGVHKFILGETTAGLVMLACTILGACVVIGPAAMHIIGIIEGIIYLTKTDEEFYRLYIVGRRGWF